MQMQQYKYLSYFLCCMKDKDKKEDRHMHIEETVCVAVCVREEVVDIIQIPIFKNVL